MLTRADTVGVFQVESRAQMATLPRMKPKTFYDLAIEVALIRPGPIQGHSVHPFLRRRNGEEEVRYPHPAAEPILAKTLGVPVFQEQLMELARVCAGYTPGQSDRLRQAMTHKRSDEEMAKLRAETYAGMASRGVTGKAADEIWEKLQGFASFGFPESHSVSFAYIVYMSAWLRAHWPTEYLAGLLNAQPMGFYSPNSLVADAGRHGVVVLPPDVNESAFDCTVVPLAADGGRRGDRRRAVVAAGAGAGRRPAAPGDGGAPGPALRARPGRDRDHPHRGGPLGRRPLHRGGGPGAAHRPEGARASRAWPPPGRWRAWGWSGGRACGRRGPWPGWARGASPWPRGPRRPAWPR